MFRRTTVCKETERLHAFHLVRIVRIREGSSLGRPLYRRTSGVPLMRRPQRRVPAEGTGAAWATVKQTTPPPGQVPRTNHLPAGRSGQVTPPFWVLQTRLYRILWYQYCQHAGRQPVQRSCCHVGRPATVPLARRYSEMVPMGLAPGRAVAEQAVAGTLLAGPSRALQVGCRRSWRTMRRKVGVPLGTL